MGLPRRSLECTTTDISYRRPWTFWSGRLFCTSQMASPTATEGTSRGAGSKRELERRNTPSQVLSDCMHSSAVQVFELSPISNPSPPVKSLAATFPLLPAALSLMKLPRAWSTLPLPPARRGASSGTAGRPLLGPGPLARRIVCSNWVSIAPLPPVMPMGREAPAPPVMSPRPPSPRAPRVSAHKAKH